MNRIFTILIGASTLWSCSCGADNKVVEEAHSRGTADAEQLSKDAPTLNQIQLERRILEVKNVEASYRREGHDKAAENYIKDFQTRLSEINDSLANVIFKP